jgi:hypothetical protein
MNPEETSDAEVLNQLLDRLKYGKAHPPAQKIAQRYPDNPSYPLAVVTCQIRLGKLRPALAFSAKLTRLSPTMRIFSDTLKPFIIRSVILRALRNLFSSC